MKSHTCSSCFFEFDHHGIDLPRCPKCTSNDFSRDPERSKREDRYIGGYFPPPWNANEYPEKSEGWIAFQEEQRKNAKYYGCGALNTVETQ